MNDRTIFVLLTMWLGMVARPVDAAVAPADACDRAAHLAAAESGVPVALLQAITRVETGRGPSAAPWPWAVNSAGKGYWFDTRQAAVDFAKAEIDIGQTRFDVGCFQMNFHWHRDRFATIEDMFDPLTNARAAATFLLELRASAGNWTDAAAAYHSRDPDRGRAYVGRVAGALDLSPAPQSAPPARSNMFPLLLRGAGGAKGSLVPLLATRRALVGER